ncbi:hypothetical protein SAMN05216167_11796 [Spirosoma endophyticum]|uniref:Uncharacterized protein n=1 Tax=Spirosoma endophyticum TaxID=662367 RepID=A0A1I2CIL1_9BACT|nr:hypothetical protein SAMN05216167_11796 [Spirosoma endophyticum]
MPENQVSMHFIKVRLLKHYLQIFQQCTYVVEGQPSIRQPQLKSIVVIHGIDVIVNMSLPRYMSQF